MRPYERGATHIKGGVAAMALAATQRARTLERSAGLVLVRIAGEVTGATERST